MKANVGVREEQYFKLAISSMAEQLRAGTDHHTALAIVLLKTLILATKGSKSAKGLSTLDAREIENYLVGAVKSVIEQFCSKWSAKSSCEAEMSLVSVALAAADDVTRQFPEDKLSLKLSKAVSPYLGQLAEVSQQLGSNTDVDIWPLRRYLAKTHGLEDKSFLDLGQTTGGVVGDEPPMITASNDGKREGILEYVDAVTADADDATRVKLLDTLLSRRSNAPSQLAQLLAVHRIVQQFEAKTLLHTRGTAAKGHDGFDLATAHTILCRRLRTAETQAEFLLITEILETILDDKSSTMTQWNVELTLSTASVLASEVRTHKVMSITPKAYPRLCRLVQVIVRRHRLRLEGHFHLLVSVLQSLLRALICYPYQAMDGAWEGGLIKDSSSFTHWAKHAKAFARLVTMVCEPTPGSVARSQQSSLDSATDAAKRYAGQYMYLVLMLYIKLQLEQNVPHDVREALEPGVFAVLDITSPEGRRIMNDALDASGRAIMKDLYKQYLKFGKWSGI
jgi:nucleolar pre-ribosomal-associated protein 2